MLALVPCPPPLLGHAGAVQATPPSPSTSTLFVLIPSPWLKFVGCGARSPRYARMYLTWSGLLELLDQGPLTLMYDKLLAFSI